MINDIGKALLNIVPGAKYTVFGDNYADIEWLDDAISKPSESDVLAAIADLPNQEARVEAEKQAKIEVKNSALAKLAALGLTQDEVKALVG